MTAQAPAIAREAARAVQRGTSFERGIIATKEREWRCEDGSVWMKKGGGRGILPKRPGGDINTMIKVISKKISFSSSFG